MSSDSTWFQRGVQTIVGIVRPNNEASTQRSGNPLREVFSDLISYVIFFDMTCEQKPLSLQEFREGVVGLVTSQEGRAKFLGVTEDNFKQARFAVLSWVDENVFNSKWPHRSQWQHLMLTYYRTSNAGEEFFRHLSQLRTQDNQVREIFYLCLSLGFQGKYAFGNEQQELKDITRDLYKKIAATGDIRKSLPRLFPEAYVKVDAAPLPKKQPALLYYVAAASVPLVLAVGLWLILHKKSDRILAQIGGTIPPIPIGELCPLGLVGELRNTIPRAVDEREKVRITLDSLSFPVLGTELSSQAKAKLGEIYAILSRCAIGKTIVVEGHASCEGDCSAPRIQETNLRISEERAETVRQALFRMGIPDGQISAIGYGTQRPISRNEAENRRVEIVVTK